MNKEMCNIRQPHPNYTDCPCYTSILQAEYRELEKSNWRFLNVRYYWLKFKLK